MTLLSRIKYELLKRARRYKREGVQGLLFIKRRIIQNKSGINLVGFFSYTMGIAEVGRFFALSAKRVELPLTIYDVASPYLSNKLDAVSLREYQSYYSNRLKYHKSIFFINAGYILLIQEQLPELFIGKYNAAVFFWEFDDYFHFPPALNVLSEVIVFTEFIATALRKAAPAGVKVTKMPFPFHKSWEITHSVQQVRKQYHIPDNAFVFIFNFDYESIYSRKNPEAILQAFESAFVPADNVRLIFKTINSSVGTISYYKLQAMLDRMQLKEKIIQVNDNLERNDFMSMIHASDCYISLHRSEGLGLGMLEAMSMGKPVIATNYGGNTDFMHAGNSLLVQYTLAPLTEDAGPYKAGWIWAEPDIKQASVFMQKLYVDRAFAHDLGQRAQASVQEQYSNNVFEKSLAEWMQS